MQLILGNRLGLLGLGGILAVIIIHFLHQKSKRIEVSTLFLLDNSSPQSLKGRRVQRFRFSVLFFLQIVTVLLLTWLLLDPRWLRKDSLLRITVIMDSSVSMRAFLQEQMPHIREALQRMGHTAAQIEWYLSESHRPQHALYRGADLAELMNALKEWQPESGTHDAFEALSSARDLSGPNAQLIFISDRPTRLPAGVRLLALGRPFENAGFTGMRTVHREGDKLQWQVLARNYGNQITDREWWLEINGQVGERQPIKLNPEQSVLLEGSFPEDAQKITVRLSPDRFSIDDVLPIVRPMRNRLRVHVEAAFPAREAVLEVLKSIPGVGFSSERGRSDLSIESFRSGQRIDLSRTAIIFLDESSGNPVEGHIVSARHALMEGLAWQSAVIRADSALEPGKHDEVLLWAGERPLVYLRSSPGARQLVFNFDLRQSNVREMPAFVLLLYRFIESLRAAHSGFKQQNILGGQLLPVHVDGTSSIKVRSERLASLVVDEQEFPAAEYSILRAPIEPAFVEVSQGTQQLFSGAIQFSDAREADFQSAAAIDQIEAENSALAIAHSEQDTRHMLWLLILLGVMLWSWAEAAPSAKRPAQQEIFGGD